MNILITASIGLYVDSNDLYYLQVIGGETDSNYLISISKFDANKISTIEQLEISELPK